MKQYLINFTVVGALSFSGAVSADSAVSSAAIDLELDRALAAIGSYMDEHAAGDRQDIEELKEITGVPVQDVIGRAVGKGAFSVFLLANKLILGKRDSLQMLFPRMFLMALTAPITLVTAIPFGVVGAVVGAGEAGVQKARELYYERQVKSALQAQYNALYAVHLQLQQATDKSQDADLTKLIKLRDRLRKHLKIAPDVVMQSELKLENITSEKDSIVNEMIALVLASNYLTDSRGERIGVEHIKALEQLIEKPKLVDANTHREIVVAMVYYFCKSYHNAKDKLYYNPLLWLAKKL
jgi:hypothetical protein